MSTTKDNRTELFLNQMGPEWKWVNGIRPEKLTPGWDVANVARPKCRMEAAIENYAALSEAGSPAPGPILRLLPSDLYDVADGVQRISAELLLGSTEFSAYVFKTDSERLAVQIRMLANARLQGHPEPPDWTKRQSVEVLIVQQGMSPEEVSRLGGWKLADIERLHGIALFGFEIRCAGGPDRLADTLVETISKHAKLADFRAASEPLAAFCNDLKRGRFSNGDATPFVKEFFGGVNRSNKKRLHDQFAKQLDHFRADPEVQARLEGRRGTGLAPEINLRRVLKGAVTTTDDLRKAGHAIRYMDEYFQIWRHVDRNLKAIAKASRTSKAKA